MASIAMKLNICGWLTRRSLRKDWGRKYAEELANLDSLIKPSARDYESMIATWLGKSVMVAGLLIVPIGWAVMETIPSALILMMVLLLFVPLAGIVSLIEIRVRLLLRVISKKFSKLEPHSLVWLANPHALQWSSLVTYLLVIFLYPVLREGLN